MKTQSSHSRASHSKEFGHVTLTAASAPRFALALASNSKAPDWVMLLPAGRVHTNDGRWFDNTRPDAVIAAFTEGGLNLPFDFEHGSELRAPMGEFAPAAGWIMELANREGAIFARVEWTEKGRAAIEQKEVRYVSPAFRIDDQSVVISISSAALTVRPAITTLPALTTHQQKESVMDKKALCAALGLAETASEADILAAIAKNKSDVAAALASRQQPSLDTHVPRADYDAVRARAETAEATLASRAAETLNAEATALIDQGVKDGKIAPASKDFYLATCANREGLDKTRAFLASAPQIVKGKADGDPIKSGEGGGTALTSQQKQVALSLGLSPEAYAKQLADDEKEQN